MPPTAPERIARTIAAAILRGDHPAGSRLPSVRSLAEAHGVTVPTIQRAVARLEATGLVSARHGSGVVVHHVDDSVDVSLLPAWVQALDDQPEQATALVADFLELRRVLAARILARRRDRVLAALPKIAATVARLGEADSLDGVIALDMAVSREMMRAAGHRAALAVLVTAERLVREVPGLAAAMYADPHQNAVAIGAAAALLVGEADPAALERGLLALLAEADAGTVARFRAHLEADR